MSGAPHPLGGVPGVLSSVRFVREDALSGLRVPWPRCQDLGSAAIAAPCKDDLVIAVSHAWSYQVHPDPQGEKAGPIRDLSAQITQAHKPRGSTLLFLDLLSVPQRPFFPGQAERTKAEAEAFATALRAFPQIYLMADATIHLEMELSTVYRDGLEYSVKLDDLRYIPMQQIGPAVQIVTGDADCQPWGLTQPAPFDFVERVQGVPVQSLSTVERALRGELAPPASSVLASMQSCCAPQGEGVAELRRAPFGRRNELSASVKGWVFLERFASMVKAAMTHESQLPKVVFSNSEEVRREILGGGARLRAAVGDQRKDRLHQVLEGFARELDGQQFSAVSIDKQLNTGGVSGLEGAREAADRDIVWTLMQEMVAYLTDNWAAEQRAQEQRQLVLAVGREDGEAVSQLLAGRADPNAPDALGWTVLHQAAVNRSPEIVQVLLRHGADSLRQDSQGFIPAHWVQLLCEPATMEVFRLLTPSPQELQHDNSAGVSPLRRFMGWAGTAENGRPYAPADSMVKELLRGGTVASLETSVSGGSAASEESGCDLVKGVCTFTTAAGGEVRRATTWENAAGAEHHILYLAFMRFAPPALVEEACRALAGSVCERYRAKLFVVTNDCFAPALFARNAAEVTHKEAMRSLHAVIIALPLNDKFVLLDESWGLYTPCLWSLQDRVAGAMIVNFALFWSDDFEGTPVQKRFQQLGAALTGDFRSREPERITRRAGDVVFAGSSESLAPKVARLDQALRAAPETYWRYYEFATSPLGLMSVTECLRRCQPLELRVPVVLVCGDQAPGLIVLGSTQRLKPLLPGAEVAYITNSKVVWLLDGKRQVSRVCSLLGDLVSRSFVFTAVPLPKERRKRRHISRDGERPALVAAPDRSSTSPQRGNEAPACCATQ